MSEAGRLSREQALYQSLAASGAAIIAFIGLIHEAVGGLILPWAPVVLGPIAWHALGISGIVAGMITFLGALRLIRAPVTFISLAAAVSALAIAVWVAVLKHETHMFAYALALAGATTAYFHRKGSA